MKKWIKRSFQNISFGRKLIIIFVIAVILPLIANSLLFYYYSRRIIEDQTFDYLQNLAFVTMSKVELSLENVEDTVFFIAGNERIQELLGSETEESDRLTSYLRYKEAKDLLSYYVLLSREISSTYIYTENGSTFSYTKRKQTPPIQELKNLDKNWICLDGHIYLKRGIYLFTTQKKLGIMITEVEAPVFYNIVKDISYSDNSKVYIVDEDNNIIAGQEESFTGQKLPKDYLDAMKGKSDGELGRAVLEGIPYSIYVGEEIHNGWKLVLALPEDYYLKDVRMLRNFTSVLLFATGMLAIVLIIFVSNGVTRPLKKLSQAMEDVGSGDFQVSFQVEGQDEIAVLGRTFNQMVEDMRTLIDNVYEQEMRKQEVEMKSLQMQINPHFLYNTLDTINWIARMRGVDEVGDMTSALGNLMRYSLSKSDFVTIDEELRNLKNYIEIQNVRYGDKMTIEFQVDEAVLGYYIPKLLVQPILENAIVHGVEDKLEPSLIQIRISREGENLYLVVEDDGVGMTQEAIEALMNMDYDTKKHGHTSIGVYNVNRRIQSVFGKSCGLQIQSQLGAGTKITLCLKILEKVPDIRLKYN